MDSPSFLTSKSPLLRQLATSLRAALDAGIPATVQGILDETALKVRFIEQKAKAIWRDFPSLDLITPPWHDGKPGPKRLCEMDLEKAKGKGVRVEIGCEECWAESKSWVSTDFWGTRHNFDMVVRDRKHGEALVTEVKMFKGNSSPNEEIQRFLGQLILARSKHPIVMGIYGRRGNANMGLFKDTEKVRHWCRRLGVESERLPPARCRLH